MNLTNKFCWFALLSILITAAILFGVAAWIWQGLLPPEKTVLIHIFRENQVYLFSAAILTLAGIGFGLDAIFHSYILPLFKLQQETAIIDAANPAHRIRLSGSRAAVQVADRVNAWADRLENLDSEVVRQTRRNMAALESERNILATFMAELEEGIIICNAEGRVLLYNNKAKTFVANPDDGPAADDPEKRPLGLGRSIYRLFERSFLANVLDEITRKLKTGAENTVVHFVMPGAAGRLLKTEVVPILNQLREFTGFILILQDITRELEAGQRVDHLLQVLARRFRASLASIRSAIETVIEYPHMAKEELGRFPQIIHQESLSLGAVLEEAIADYSRLIEREWPLVAMPVDRFLANLPARARQKAGVALDIPPADSGRRARMDTFSLEWAVFFLLIQLKEKTGQERFSIASGGEGELVHIDLFWEGPPLILETLRAWEQLPLTLGAETLPFSLQEVIRHHGAELWPLACRERPELACLRLFMPAAGRDTTAGEGRLFILKTGRPDFYDFDLFQQPGQLRELDQQPLAGLTYTVFDTETTGLDPRGGDEIIAIGAVRIVNGHLLREEVFHELVDPRRPVSAESIRIHGLTPEVLRGRPLIGDVLPRFHRFVEDTVLVGHNVAFDMKMLQMKETETGISFINPVLDTLLLSAVLHSAQNDHTLEAIASRLGIGIIGRHTAMGDAMATAELFLKLLPLLAQNGIRTLGEARDASRQTFYARIRY